MFKLEITLNVENRVELGKPEYKSEVVGGTLLEVKNKWHDLVLDTARTVGISGRIYTNLKYTENDKEIESKDMLLKISKDYSILAKIC